MTVDARTRLRVHPRFEALIGAEEADLVVEAIFPNTEVATKADIDQLRHGTRADIDSLRTELRSEMHELRVEMHQGFAAQTRWLSGFMVAWSGVVLVAVKLLL